METRMVFGVLSFVLLLATAGLKLTSAQAVTDCEDIAAGLGISTSVQPTTEPNLPICVDQRSAPQCCSTQFILKRRTQARQSFKDGLMAELKERFQPFKTLVSDLRNFIEGQFLSAYFRDVSNLDYVGAARGVTHISNYISDFHNHIDFSPGDDTGNQVTPNTFSVRMFLGNMLATIENTAIQTVEANSNFMSSNKCVRQVMKNNTLVQNINAHVAALQQIRRVMASVANLRRFIDNLTDSEDLAGFRPLPQCVDTVVRLETCGRCAAIRPLFCKNVCEAIASACYSPFNDTMTEQLNELWAVVRQVVNATTDAIDLLNVNKDLVNKTAIVTDLSTKCKIYLLKPQISGDPTIPPLPAHVKTIAISLRGGPFNYTARQVEGAGICRHHFKTGKNKCWDGNVVRKGDISPFNGTTIRDQVNNPIISIPQSTLMNQAASLGTPITSMLNNPSFSLIAPLGLVIPGSSAAGLLLSMTSFILLIFCSIFVTF